MAGGVFPCLRPGNSLKPQPPEHPERRERVQSYEVREIKVGQAHGAPRVWLEGKRLAKAGFQIGAKYLLSVGNHCVTLKIAADGERVVSAKKKAGEELPLIDL